MRVVIRRRDRRASDRGALPSRWRASSTSADVACGRPQRRARTAAAGSPRWCELRGWRRTPFVPGCESLKARRSSRDGCAGGAGAASRSQRPTRAWWRISSVSSILTRGATPSSRCAGRPRAYASSPRRCAGQGTRSLTRRWRGCCARSATACRPTKRRARGPATPTATSSFATSTASPPRRSSQARR